MWSDKMPTCVGNSETTLLEQQHFVKVDKPVPGYKSMALVDKHFKLQNKNPLYEILFL